MKHLTKILIHTSLAFSAGLIAGCDGSAPDETGGIVVNGRGIDVANVTANPTATAAMPSILLPGERIEHSDATHLGIREVSQLGNPLIINTAGGASIDNISLSYARSEVTPSDGILRLARNNDFPDFDPTIREDFQARFDILISSSSGSSDSLQSALGSRITNQTWIDVLRAARSIGILTALGPEPDAFPDTELPYVLVDRTVTYTVTSTNQTLLDTQEIRGTYQIEDRWAQPALLAVTDDDDLITADEFDQVTLRFNEPLQMLITQDDLSTGTFVLRLNNL